MSRASSKIKCVEWLYFFRRLPQGINSKLALKNKALPHVPLLNIVLATPVDVKCILQLGACDQLEIAMGFLLS